METVILDTSVVIKWYTQEEGTIEAVSLLTKYKTGNLNIIIPSILPLELANALYFGLGFRQKNHEEALKEFFNLNIPLVQLTDKIIRDASRLMEKFSIAIYDAVFLNIAEEKRIPLITADKKHHQKKYSKFISYLNDLSL